MTARSRRLIASVSGAGTSKSPARRAPRAGAGDAVAQCYIAKALEYCERGYRTYFDRAGWSRRTLDEALQ